MGKGFHSATHKIEGKEDTTDTKDDSSDVIDGSIFCEEETDCSEKEHG